MPTVLDTKLSGINVKPGLGCLPVLYSDPIVYLNILFVFQVVFQDIEDRYPNNKDLECHFTLTGELTSDEHDRIGLYRVPSFAPHDYIAFKWVTSDMLVDPKDKTFKIVFEGKFFFMCCPYYHFCE